MGLCLDHIGVAVESLRERAKFYSLLGLELSGIEEVASEEVKVGLLELKNEANIELLEATSETSPVARFLKKKGPGVHHICFRVEDIHGILARLKRQGVRLIDEKAKTGAHGCLVAFIHPSATGGVLIELSESSRGSSE